MKTDHVHQNLNDFTVLQHAVAILCWHERWISHKQITILLDHCHDEAALHLFCQTRGLYEHFSELGEVGKRGKLLIDAYAEQGITILFLNDEAYPPQMRTLTDTKPILSVSGNSKILKQAQVAIVGSRDLIQAAVAPTRQLAQHLINCGFIITSGGAIGIDAIAHRCAIQANQPSIIVTATSVDRIYPKENSDIFEYCRINGAIVSHSPIDTPPERRLFPTRNATIAGLSQATIIAQAGLLSGALYTAKASFSLNRPVYVLSMPAFNEACLGGFKLVRDQKAKHIADVGDLEELTHSLEKPVKSRGLFDMNSSNAKTHNKPSRISSISSVKALKSLDTKANGSVEICPPNSIQTWSVHSDILNKLKNAWLTRETLRSSLRNTSYDEFNSAILDLELNGSIIYTAGRFKLNH